MNRSAVAGNLRNFFLIAIVLAWAWVIYEQIGEQRSLHDAFVAGGALVLAAVVLANCNLAGRGPSAIDSALLVALTALGALPRLLYFDEYPPATGQLWEEAQLGMIAVDSIRHDALDLFFPLPNLMGELGVRLFGVSMRALRLPFVAAGIVAVPVFFLAARILGASTFAATSATALFASSAYLAGSSRIAFETYSPILTECAALAAAFYASRRRSTAAFALAGCLAGLLMTEYTSFKLYPPLILAMLLLALRAAPEIRGFPAAALRVGAFALAAVAVMAPLLLVPGALEVQVEGIVRQRAGMDHARASSRDHAQASWAERATAAAGRVGESAAQVFLRGAANDVLPDSTGVVDLYTGLVGLVALAYCAYRWRSPEALFLVATVGATVVLAGVLAGNPARYRLTPIVPLYFLAIALAIDELRRRWQSPRAGAAIAVAVTMLCAVNLHLLLVVTVRHPRVHAEFGDRAMGQALEIARLQKSFDGPILLDTADTYLAQENDYAFLYQLDRVHLVRQRDDLAHRDGMLLADAARAGELRRLPSISGCSMQTYDYGPLLGFSFLTCENSASAQCSLDEDPLP